MPFPSGYQLIFAHQSRNAILAAPNTVLPNLSCYPGASIALFVGFQYFHQEGYNAHVRYAVHRHTRKPRHTHGPLVGEVLH
jgi:hypothetical protein